MIKKLAIVGVLASLGAVSNVANALPLLTGDVNYFGDFSLDAGATGFSTSNNVNIANAIVSSTTDGSFAGLGMNFPDALAHVAAIDIAPPPAVGGYNPLWTWTDGLNTVQFILTSYTITQRTAGFLDLNGTGYFTATGFAQTDGKWNLSAQLSTGQVRATYSASSVVPVPEPASLAIFGLGLIGAGVAARRKARAEA